MLYIGSKGKKISSPKIMCKNHSQCLKIIKMFLLEFLLKLTLLPLMAAYVRPMLASTLCTLRLLFHWFHFETFSWYFAPKVKSNYSFVSENEFEYCTERTLFEKSNFCPTIQFWQNPNIFTQFFSWNLSCQELRSPKPQHFHEFFTQKIDNFLGKSKLNFWTKN